MLVISNEHNWLFSIRSTSSSLNGENISANREFLTSGWCDEKFHCGNPRERNRCEALFFHKDSLRELWDKNCLTPEDLDVEKLWLLSDAECYIDSILSRFWVKKPWQQTITSMSYLTTTPTMGLHVGRLQNLLPHLFGTYTSGIPHKTKVMTIIKKDTQGSFENYDGKFTNNVVYTEIFQ